MKSSILLLCTLSVYCSTDTSVQVINIPHHIEIRPAQEEDLPSLYEMDRVVTYEYFKPLYIAGYSHLKLGQDPDSFLEPELIAYESWFPQCINRTVSDRLWIAYDTSNKKPAGLIVTHKEIDDSLETDLLLISKEHRRMGLGRELIYTAITSCPEVRFVTVHPFKFANDDTIAFYKALGFRKTEFSHDLINSYGYKYGDLYLQFKLELNKNILGIKIKPYSYSPLHA